MFKLINSLIVLKYFHVFGNEKHICDLNVRKSMIFVLLGVSINFTQKGRRKHKHILRLCEEISRFIH